MSSHDYQRLDSSSTASPMMSSAMTDSKYSRVIFTDIKDFYSSAAVECRLYCDTLAIDSEDQVIIQKVGGDQRLAAKKISDCPEDSDGQDFGERIVRFSREDLRNSDDIEDDFFQFLYLKKGEVCGASTPFRFRAEDDDSDEDFLVVRSPEALLKERIQRLLSITGSLEEEKRKLVDETEGLKNLIKEIETKLSVAESKVVAANEQLEGNRGAHTVLEQHISNLNDEKKRLLEEFVGEKKAKEELEMSLAAVKMERDRTLEQMDERVRKFETYIIELETRLENKEVIYQDAQQAFRKQMTQVSQPKSYAITH